MKLYTNVSNSPLSVAKFYGGAIIQDQEYIYDSVNDTLYSKKDKKEYLKSISPAKEVIEIKTEVDNQTTLF
jgi:hypothetical protein